MPLDCQAYASDMAANGQQMDEALVARAVRAFRVVAVIQLPFFVMFGVGGFLLVYDFGKQSQPAFGSCGGTPFCSSPSLAVPIVLIAVGFFGMIITMVVATQWAIRTLGVGAIAYLRRRRRMGAAGGMETGVMGMDGPPSWPGGMPPGTPGSPTGPPLP
jgi:hypothetical protein